MEFNKSLKIEAQKIIKLSKQLGDRVHTWNQEKFAPIDGYKDRAGFVIFDDIELFADIFVSEENLESKVRARLAWAPKDKDQELFTIITLDFRTNITKAKNLIDKANNLTHEDIVGLLDDTETKPCLIQVSLESGTAEDGTRIGERFEYAGNSIEDITHEEESEFIVTVTKAYDFIVAKI